MLLLLISCVKSENNFTDGLIYNEDTQSVVGFKCSWEKGWCAGWRNVDYSNTANYEPTKVSLIEGIAFVRDKTEKCERTAQTALSEVLAFKLNSACALFMVCLNLKHLQHFDFVVRKGSSPSPSTGPSFDHTYKNESGHYLLLDGSGHKFLSRAEISTPNFDFGAFRVSFIVLSKIKNYYIKIFTPSKSCFY